MVAIRLSRWVLLWILTFALFHAPAAAQTLCDSSLQSVGLLQRHPTNPRVFTDGTVDPDTGECKAIILTGSHHWSNVQQYLGEGNPDNPNWPNSNDWDDLWYLDNIVLLGHNFMRGWIWEDDYYEPTVYFDTDTDTAAYQYDLNVVNPDYIQKLDTLADEAASKGVYLSVLLFQGWSLRGDEEFRDPAPWCTPTGTPPDCSQDKGHPYQETRNVNAIDGDAEGDDDGHEVHVLPHPDNVFDLQLAYAKTIVDALNHHDNIIWEITNESPLDSWQWQYDLIDEIRDYEATMKTADSPPEDYKRHLIWMSCSRADDSSSATGNAFLADAGNTADIVSPCGDAGEGYKSDTNVDPPELSPQDQHHLSIFDTDHLSPIDAVPEFVWKSMLRGYHPIFMDLSYHLDWWDGNRNWTPTDPQWGEIKSSLEAVQKVLDGRVDMARMAPQKKGTDFPSDSHFSLFSTQDHVDPQADGFQMLVYGTSATKVCELIENTQYVRRVFDEIDGALKGTSTRTSSGNGCLSFSPSPGRAIHVLTVKDHPPVALFATEPPHINGHLFVEVSTEVTFEGRASFDPDGGPLTDHDWDLDGDGVFTDSGAEVSKVFETVDEVDINLRVTDDEMDTDTAAAVTVHVLERALITRQPTSVSGMAGSTARFEVEAAGTNLSYQWNRDGVLLSDGADVSGATTSVLTLANIEDANEATYDCTISNALGSVTSNGAVLTLLAGTSALRASFDGGTAGQTLNGWAAAVGGLSFESQQGLVFGQDGGVTATGYKTGGVAFDPLGLVTTIEADVDPKDSAFVGIGFAREPNAGLNAPGNGLVWVRIEPDGSWAVHEYGETITVGECDAVVDPSCPIVAGTYNHVALTYDPLRNSVSLRIDDVEVLPETDLVMRPAITGATMTFGTGSVQDSTRLDNFEVHQELAPIRDAFSSSVEARDTFAGGIPDATLNGRVTEIGGLVFDTQQNLVFGNDGGVTATGYKAGGVPFDPSINDLVTTIEADINPKDSTFVGVGFGAQARSSLNGDLGRLWVRLEEGGDWLVYEHDGPSSSQTKVAEGTGVVGDKYNHVALSFDPVANTVSLHLNGVEVLPETALSLSLTIGGASMTFGSGSVKNSSRLDNFVIRQEPPAGDTINGRITEVGGLTFESQQGLVFGQDGSVTATGYKAGGVAFDPLGLVATLEADIDPKDSSFVGIGFAREPNVGLNAPGNGRVWVRIEPDGSWAVYEYGETILVGECDAAVDPSCPIVAGTYNHVALTFDPLRNTVSLRIDDVEVLPETDLVLRPAITGATMTFGANSVQDSTRLDNFEVRQESAPIRDTFSSRVVVRDTFSNGSSGQTIDGRVTEIGGLTFESATGGGSLEFGSDGAITAQNFKQGGVPFDPTASGLVTTIEADINPEGAAFVGIGFGSVANSSLTTTGVGQLWVKVKDNGKWWVHQDGDDTTLGTASTGNIQSDKYNHVALTYDPVADTVSLRINGVTVLSDEPLVDSVSIGGASMTFGNSSAIDVTLLDNFVIRQEPPAGATINGRITEVGGLVFESQNTLVFGQDDGVTSVSGHKRGGVPLDPAATGLVTTIEASIDPKDAQFVGIGFGLEPDSSLNSAGQGQLWVKIQGDDGRWRVFRDGENEQLDTDTTGNIVEGAYNRVSLRYDPLLNTATLVINGVEVMSETSLSQVPTIGGATITFGGGSVQDLTRLDDFQVRR